ncbi:BRO family protein [Paraburkholderia sp. BL6665CI2N2]|uniref:BRO-N domain-containing protein n=1 Tax=Paraburkholderia sp. BL6665CI2N2 TaxID=1938806 RepID=UPI0010655700|nr:BRO family protein [Paraburkholderia sp. BL6665CI2N2]TDY23597.1 BRO family protein [Paraburkholderia sp. BL6665CI2N2]
MDQFTKNEVAQATDVLMVRDNAAPDMRGFVFDMNAVRVIVIDGEPWFVAKDVAEVLGYADTDKAIRAHCKAATTYPAEMAGQVRHIKLVSERDLYRLVFKSKLPAAERFEDWVVSRVLPSIRRTGSYSAPPVIAAPKAKHLPSQRGSVEAATAIVTMTATLLNLSQSARLLSAQRLADEYGVSRRLLPATASDEPADWNSGAAEETASLSALLQKHQVKMGAIKFYLVLQAAGVVMRRTRPTTQTKRYPSGVRPFWAVTKDGLKFAKNITNVVAQREVAPHFYESRFGELLESVKPTIARMQKEGEL